MPVPKLLSVSTIPPKQRSTNHDQPRIENDGRSDGTWRLSMFASRSDVLDWRHKDKKRYVKAYETNKKNVNETKRRSYETLTRTKRPRMVDHKSVMITCKKQQGRSYFSNHSKPTWSAYLTRPDLTEPQELFTHRLVLFVAAFILNVSHNHLCIPLT